MDTSCTRRVAVVGSGPSGMAAAAILIERGCRVDVFDGGKTPGGEEAVFAKQLAERLTAGDSITQQDRRFLAFGDAPPRPLKAVAHTLNTIAGGSLDPTLLKKRILGSTYVFDGVDEGIPLVGATLVRSLATGGLSNAWGTACYPLRREDYGQWPLSEHELAPWYRRSTRLAQVDAIADNLSDAYPLYGFDGNAASPGHAESRTGLDQLFAQWKAYRDALASSGVTAGRSRLAVTDVEHPSRPCIRCGLCFYGCPTGAMWSSVEALEALRSHPHFQHLPGKIVRQVEESESSARLVFSDADGRVRTSGTYNAVFLAAGPISSLRIAAETLCIYGLERPFLENDMFIVPFRAVPPVVFPRSEPDFTLSEAVLAFDAGVASQYPLHMQLYRISDPLLGPLKELLCIMPTWLRQMIVRQAQRYLIGFVYLNSSESRPATISIEKRATAESAAVCRFGSNPEADRIARRLLHFMADRAGMLGIRPFDRLLRLTPPGFSCHFGGTLPMKRRPGRLETSLDGRLIGSRHCYVVDSSSVPAVPAQNFTLTLMANAMRIAAQYGQQ